MTIEKPKPKQLLRPITIGTNSAINQSQFLAITCNSLEAREKSRAHGAIGFGFTSHWLKNWCESFKLISKGSNRNRVITNYSHLKNALFRAVFKWVSKVITWLRLLRLVISLKDSRQFFSLRKAKPKPIAPCTRDFFRPACSFCDWSE